MFKFFLTIGLIVIMSGCVPQPKLISLTNKFDADETKAKIQKGNNTIKGSALLRQMNGNVVTCAGREVSAVPVTKYSEERISYIYGNTNKGYTRCKILFDDQKDIQEYYYLMLKTTCDAQGYFKFDNLADGEYFIGTKIIWFTGELRGWNSDYVTQGGNLMQRVSIKGGELKEIVLSQ